MKTTATLSVLACLQLLSLTAGNNLSQNNLLENHPPVDVDDTILFRRHLQPISPDQATSEWPCDLECLNGGTCEYITGTAEDWRYMAQTGILVQKCKCPPGYGGIGCEMQVEDCIEDGYVDQVTGKYRDTYTCKISGKPCDILPDGTATCACHVADAVDPNLAGKFCRRWNTEYCAGGLQEQNGSVYLCTNGGKCQSDFIAAQVDPGNTKVNSQYADAGCVCNQNFYGPHCEFLDFDQEHNVIYQDGNGQVVPEWHGDGEKSLQSQDKGNGSFLIALIVFVALSSVVLFMYRRRQRRAWRAASTNDGIFKDQEQVEFADTSLPPAGQDPYVDAVMEDIDLGGGEHDPLEPPAASPPVIDSAPPTVLDQATPTTDSFQDAVTDNVAEDNEQDEETAPVLQGTTSSQDETTHHFFT